MSSNTQTAQVTRWVLVALALVVLAFAMWLTRDTLMLPLTAVIFAVLLTSPVRFFVKRGIKRPVAVFITLVLIIAVLIAAGAVLLPGLLDQFRQLVADYIPRAAAQLQDELQAPKLIQRFPFLQGLNPQDVAKVTDQISTQLLGGLANVGSQIFPFVGGLASTLLSILIVVFLALYFVADPDMHERGMVKLIPIRYRPRALEIIGKLDRTLRNFLQAQILLMLLIGVSTGLALGIIGVPLAGAPRPITGLFSFFPDVRPPGSLSPFLARSPVTISPPNGFIVGVFFIF